MACGTPCVVTDVGDSARIVGSMGEVVPMKNPEALAEAVETTLSRIHTGSYQEEHLRQRIAERFSVSTLITSTELSLIRLTQDC
jgi:glycosyltransferase involved in cell wall biosynthesis